MLKPKGNTVNVAEMIEAYDNRCKGSKIAAQNRQLKSPSQPHDYIGRPGGPKAKGHKTPATGILPVIRSSVIPNGNHIATKGNAARAKNLQAARRKAIKAAKNSVQI